MNEEKKFPEGHFVGMWIGICIAMFSGLGIPLSIATDNFAFMGIGPAIGVSIGVSVGTAIENKKKAEGLIRPLTDEEKRTRKILVASGVVVALVGVALFLFLLLG
jgi:hypothetical protein